MVNRYQVRQIGYKAVLYGGTAIFLFIALFPFVWVLIGSFHASEDLQQGNVHILNDNLTFQHYQTLFQAQQGVKVFTQYILNSLFVGLSTAILTMTLSVLGAYGLSRYNLRGASTISRSLLFVYVFPVILLIVPLYQVMATLQILDTHVALILVHTALAAPFCTWLLRSFFDSVPDVIEEAAVVDGANPLQRFFYVLLPMTAPGVLTAGMYALVISWGEYTFAANLLTSNDKWTVPLGLSTYMTAQAIEWGQLLAGTILTALPLLLIFFPLAHYFLKGFLQGAIR